MAINLKNRNSTKEKFSLAICCVCFLVEYINTPKTVLSLRLGAFHFYFSPKFLADLNPKEMKNINDIYVWNLK
jgi:hypothetical protein